MKCDRPGPAPDEQPLTNSENADSNIGHVKQPVIDYLAMFIIPANQVIFQEFRQTAIAPA